MFDKTPHGGAEARRSAWRWKELGIQFCFLTICFERLMQQESKRGKHPNQRFSHILWIYKNHPNRNSQDIFVSWLLNAVLVV